MSTSSTNSGWVLYHYTPSKGGAIAVTVLFIVLTIFYTIQFIWDAKQSSKEIYDDPFKSEEKDYSTSEISPSKDYKELKISSTTLVFIPFLIGCIMEIIGYIGRALSSSNPQATGPYIIQSILLLIAPALYAATIYMIFGRMLQVLRCQSLMIISSRFGTSFFVFGDVVSFFMQAAGGGLMSQDGSRKTGSNVITGGLVVQVVFFAFFIINELRFAWRVRSVCPFYQYISKRWQFLNFTLLISSVLIMVRSIVRLVEFAQGSDGFIISHEYFIYVFDAIPILLVVITFIVGSYFGSIFQTIRECQTLK
ncbi:LAFE_0C01706g1_1 [Lachancea fermentati]|uniref:LAFE_0C01706g1_1 n=1 Tax=Lachancea fermentati TaxID=4955 RepID=A0A1G4M900_LACFM|nr:LAFE_0C01706g1_1 [Lachancea fermentati]